MTIFVTLSNERQKIVVSIICLTFLYDVLKIGMCHMILFVNRLGLHISSFTYVGMGFAQ